MIFSKTYAKTYAYSRGIGTARKHREAIRWIYVYGRDPVAMARTLAVSKQGLQELVTDGRIMLKNRIGG